ncbi:hypothetical protein Cni_G23795 [Canna indica]|uniref:Membrane lipoprotein n=1 Tax=Canna indica TaxID=4628 RepID=A0AAQ3QKU6_9LILI|nr:hypothetical protein Cni_G23795 [Canna indica]
MRPLSSLGIGLSLVSGCLFLALVAELYYLCWWRKRARTDIEDEHRSPAAKELLHLFCWKKPSSLSTTALSPRDMSSSVDLAAYSHEQHLQLHSNSSKDYLLKPIGGDDTLEAELMRLHSLAGPPRFLFTIKEETKEDLESEDGRSGGKSLSDLFGSSETPFLTPLSSPPFFTPPLTPYRQNGFHPVFESPKEEEFIRMWSSPPPKFKFLKDAEEKLFRKKKLMEEEEGNNVTRQESAASDEEDGSFITIVIGKNRDRGQQHHSSSSQVIPLSSSPSSIR